MASTAETSTTGRHISALDGIRGMAIVLVLLCHLFSYNLNYTGGLPLRLLARTLDAGWIGVDLFFALSGFLITGILYDTQNGTRFFRNFYARRCLRIMPLYYGFLFCSVVAAVLLGYQWYGNGLLAYVTYTSNLVHAGPLTNLLWINLVPFWSLAVEEQFYLLWPAAVYLMSSKKRIVAMALMLAACSIAVRVWLLFSGRTAMYPEMPYSWTPASLDILLLGAVLAILIRSRYRDRVLALAPYAAAAGVGVVLLYGVYAGGLHRVGDPVMSTVGYTVIGLVSCAIIACALRANSVQERFFAAATLRFFGTYSYGLYVFHFTVLRLLDVRFRPLVREHMPNALAITATGLVAALLSVALALLSFHGFEKPVLSLKRHFQDGGRTPKLRRTLAARA